MAFAKLFGADDDQILVKLDHNDEGSPEVRFFWQPPDLGVCSVALGFNNEDEEVAWSRAEQVFAAVDEAGARRVVGQQMEALGALKIG